MNLDELLCYLEDHIDPEHCERVEKLHAQAMDYQPIDHPPLCVNIPTDPRVTPFLYEEAAQDFDKMLYNELTAIDCNVLNSIETKDDYPLQIRPNYGVGLIPSLYGAGIKVRGNSMPWVEHMSLDEGVALISKGLPDLEAGLGKKVRQCCEHFRERLAPYPKCSKYIHITQPDLQGPFDNLHLMMGADVFYHLVEEPETMHDLLNMLTQSYIGYRQYIDPYLTDSADNGKKCYVHFGLYAAPIVVKEDTATACISQDMYEEFALPYNLKIYETFGGGSLHYCGKEKPWHYESIVKKPISCLNFGNSELHDWKNDFPFLQQRKICIVNVGEGQPYQFYEKLIEQDLIPTGVTLMTHASTRYEAVAILNRHRGL